MNNVQKSPILQMKNIYVSYGSQQALNGVDFDLYEGEIHGLVGEHRAGKSTLVKDYVSLHPRTETEEQTIIPVFHMTTPSPVTVKGMAEAILQQLGDPAAHRGTLLSPRLFVSRLGECESARPLLCCSHGYRSRRIDRNLRSRPP